MALASFIISNSALLSTITSVWWLQARRGRLTCFPVQTFSGYLARDGAALRIPLSIFNSEKVTVTVPVIVANGDGVSSKAGTKSPTVKS